jgi:hypothetical protein
MRKAYITLVQTPHEEISLGHFGGRWQDNIEFILDKLVLKMSLD